MWSIVFIVSSYTSTKTFTLKRNCRLATFTYVLVSNQYSVAVCESCIWLSYFMKYGTKGHVQWHIKWHRGGNTSIWGQATSQARSGYPGGYIHHYSEENTEVYGLRKCRMCQHPLWSRVHSYTVDEPLQGRGSPASVSLKVQCTVPVEETGDQKVHVECTRQSKKSNWTAILLTSAVHVHIRPQGACDTVPHKLETGKQVCKIHLSSTKNSNVASPQQHVLVSVTWWLAVCGQL